jgi:Zn-dependent protease
MSSEFVLQILFYAVPIIVAVTLHEAAHGYVALMCGDRTAKDAGRVTLNPIKHVDLFGTILLPLILLLSQTGFLFGYAKPVPVSYDLLRNPRWDMVWVAAAGPGMNLALALISALSLYGAGALDGEGAAFLGNVLLLSVELNIMLAVFNMLPLPPLDGSKVVAAFLPETLLRPYVNFGRHGMTVLLLILIVLPILAAQTGRNFDVFGPLVGVPSDWLTRNLLALFGLRQ